VVVKFLNRTESMCYEVLRAGLHVGNGKGAPMLKEKDKKRKRNLEFDLKKKFR